MDYEKILQTVKEDLVQEGLDCMVLADKDAFQTKLLIYSGEDQEKRMRLIEVKVQAKSGNPLQLKETGQDCVAFQLDAFFPFTVDDLSMSDVAQFLHFLNLQIEIPGFYLNHIDNTIVYRYVLLAEDQHIPKRILLSLIGIAMMLQDVFGQTLERLSLGQVSFVELMEEIQSVMEKAMTKFS
ncbi:MAG TPA: hypothetical protein VGP47_05995 [Parachlamydiaceae bacterium]|nr:hypothetical protein [Parachlamydiaceae bacterium]